MNQIEILGYDEDTRRKASMSVYCRTREDYELVMAQLQEVLMAYVQRAYPHMPMIPIGTESTPGTAPTSKLMQPPDERSW